MKPETRNLKPELGNKHVRFVFLVVILCLSVGALTYEVRNIAADYVAPIFARTFGFVADFQFFHEGAQRFLESPDLLYEGNTHDGFLFLKTGARVDYGYPPPAVLLFVPFAGLSLPPAFLAFLLVSILTTVVCVWLIRVLYEWDGGGQWGAFTWVVLTVVVLSLGMTYVTYIFGQVNAFVLFLCLLYIAALMQGRYVLAGILVGLGFWLKFYPLFLLALAPFERRPVRLLLSSALGILVLPLALLPILPVELYDQYFRFIYPELAAQTAPHVYNQSIIGYLTRLLSSKDAIFSWGPFLVDPRVRMANAAALVSVFGWLAAGYWKNRSRRLVYYACVMAVTPMLVTYGWGGTYLLAVPLVLIVILELLRKGWWGYGLILVILGALIFPAYRPFDFEGLGSIAAHVYYSRYLFLIAIMAVAMTWRDVTGIFTRKEEE